VVLIWQYDHHSGDTGWIIVDTLTSKETAEAALKFA
jgi:alkyl sulfatase BDS1-like metallo-beta-lactamase superfamily hydrolase